MRKRKKKEILIAKEIPLRTWILITVTTFVGAVEVIMAAAGAFEQVCFCRCNAATFLLIGEN